MTRPAILALLLAPIACQPVSGDFPSLLPRPVERRSEAIVAPPPAPPTGDAVTLERIDVLLTDGERAATDFTGAEADVAGIVQRAGAAGSDSWVQAQIALARLDAPRGSAMAAVTALDTLFAAELAAGRQPPPPAEARKEALARRVRDQAATLDRLRASLAPA